MMLPLGPGRDRVILWMAPSSTSLVYFQEKIRRNYLRSGFVIDVLACLPYDALNIFDKDKVFGNADGSGTGYGNIFSILKVRPIKSKQLGAMIWCTYLGHKRGLWEIWVWLSVCMWVWVVVCSEVQGVGYEWQHGKWVWELCKPY